MTARDEPLSARPASKALAAHYRVIRPRRLRDLFASDPGRGERLAVDAVGLNFTPAERIIPELEDTAEPRLGHDSSTNALIRRYRAGKVV
jgi:hypothetical protein